jgi:hypothetical protein
MAVEGSLLGCRVGMELGDLRVLLEVVGNSLSRGRNGNHWGVMWKDEDCRKDCNCQ